MKRNIRLPLILAACATMFFMQGCFDLDSHIFNNVRLSSYSLPTGVIAESSRVQVVLSVNGNKVYGYFVKSNGAHPEKVILYSHGNKDHLQNYWDRMELMYKMGFNVFIYDYEGFGMSEGEATESAMYADAVSAYGYLHGRGFADSGIVLYGYSLGCTPSTYLGANNFTPWAMVLEAPFASSTTLAQSVMLLSNPASFLMSGAFDNLDRMPRIHAPLLVMHGIDDKFLDITKNGKAVYDAANPPKQFIQVPGADHTEVPLRMGDSLYIATVRDFILRVH